MKSSNFLDSDSDSVPSLDSEDSSDESLPKYNICTPEKRQRILSSTSKAPGTAPRLLASPNHISTSAPQRQGSSPTTPKKPLNSNVFGQSSTGGNSPTEKKSMASASLANHLASLKRTSGYTSSNHSLLGVSGMCGPSSTVVGSSFHSPTRPALMSSSPSCSPMQLSERHGRALQQYSKLTRKMEPLTADIKSRMEKNSKLEAYRTSGGIRGLSSDVEKTSNHSVSSECEEDTRPSLLKTRQPHIEDDKFPLPVRPPGLHLLVHPPVLLRTLKPPRERLSNLEYRTWNPPTTRDGEQSAECSGKGTDWTLSDDPQFLYHLICNHWFTMEYASKPCSPHIWNWLFEISCKSCDTSIGEVSLATLISLLRVAGETDHKSWHVLVLCPSYIIEVLVALGADRGKLQVDSLVKGQVRQNAPSEQSGKLLEAVEVGLKHLFTYLDKSILCRPQRMTPEDLLHTVVLTVTVALDSHLLQLSDSGLTRAISNALSSLLDCVPDDAWPEWHVRAASKLQPLSSHHHDCLHICGIILSSSRRSEELKRLVIRKQLISVLFPGNVAGNTIDLIKDWKLAWSLVKFYNDKPSSAFEYYSMYSCVCLLGMLFALSVENDWPPKEEAEVKTMLSNLGGIKIKDNVDHLERFPVKDFFIYLWTEMDSRKKSKSLRQSNLFDFC